MKKIWLIHPYFDKIHNKNKHKLYYDNLEKLGKKSKYDITCFI